MAPIYRNLLRSSVSGAFIFVIHSLTAQEVADAAGKTIPPTSETSVYEIVNEGNKLLGKGRFTQALPLLLSALEKDPANSDINFKAGMCYYNSENQKIKALPFFKKATKNLTEHYDFYKTANTQAPLEALYFLAESFLFTSQADSALNYFLQYRGKSRGTAAVDVTDHLLMCINLKNAKRNPRDVKLVNAGKALQSEFADKNPVVTLDNSIIFFSSNRVRKDSASAKEKEPEQEDIYYTNRNANGAWQAPAPFKHNTPDNEAPLFISPDGLTLYLKREKNGNYDIFISRYVDKAWTVPQSLGVVNSAFNETGLSISSDGKYLYFSSDREGGMGKSDIYQCIKKANGKWGSPKNLGEWVNSSFHELSPFIHPNGKTLFFISNGHRHKSIGGFDVFFTEMQADGSWSDPQNMGYPINSPQDNINYYITSGGKRYCSSLTKENSFDIYQIEGGGFDVENIDAGAEVVRLTTEMSVTELMEVQKEVEKEVQVVETVEKEKIVEKEVMIEQAVEADMSSAERAKAEAEKAKADAERAKAEEEKAKADIELAKIEAEKAKANAVIAEAQRVKMEIEKAKVETERLKAEARNNALKAKIAEAERIKALAAEAKSRADQAKAEAEKAKAEAVIASLEKAKLNADEARSKAETAKANASEQKSIADKAKADADVVKAEAAKATAEAAKLKAQTDAETAARLKAEADLKKAELQVKISEANKVKAEASKAASEAAKARAQADAETAARLKAEANLKKAELQVKISETEMTKALASKAASETAKVKAQADLEKAIAVKEEAARVKAEASKAASEASKSRAEAQRAKAESDKAKAESDKAASEAAKLKLETDKIAAATVKAKADEDRLKAETEKLRVEAEKKKAEAEIAASEKMKLEIERDKARKERAEAELKLMNEKKKAAPKK